MAKVVVLGAGISGHTAAAYLRKWLHKNHEIVVVTPNSYYQWIPSNIWVGVERMTIDQIHFKLAPLYKKWGIIYKQAKAVSIHPEGETAVEKGFVTIQFTDSEKNGQLEKVDFDFLINATGPKLNFEATEGLIPSGHRVSVCTYDLASHAWQKLQECIKIGKSLMKRKASMGKMGAACIVSAGFGLTKGAAAAMTVSPIVPDWPKYTQWGRNIKDTIGEPGLAGYWMKWFMHYMFLHKAKGYPFWYLLPE